MHALLALARGRDQLLTERIEVLETTRAGAVDVQETDLRRIERDLHDGAQARLVALGMNLGMAEQKLANDPARHGSCSPRRGSGRGGAQGASRPGARHPPAVLTDRGLGAAIEALVDHSALPVDVTVAVPRVRRPRSRRPPTSSPPRRSTNAAKHANASGRRSASARRRVLVLEVADDGSGGADPAGRGLTRPAPPRRGARRDADGHEPAVGRPSSGGAAMRVLIAEDLALLRDGLARLLRDNGFDVVGAVADGDALVHAAILERPDIAIVDIRLPPTFRDEGLRAALELRKLMPETAILVVSQYVERTYATELLAEGAAASATC